MLATISPADQWVVWFGVFVGVVTLDSVAGTRLIPRAVMAAYRNNVGTPLAGRAKKRRDAITAEVVTDLEAIVKNAIRDTLQTPNGKVNFTDLMGAVKQIDGRMAAGDRRMTRLETQGHMHTEMVQALREKVDDYTDKVLSSGILREAVDRRVEETKRRKL